MESLKQVITEVRALQAVVGVLTRSKADDEQFRDEVIKLVNHMAKELTPKEGEDLRIAAQMLIDQ